MNNRTRLSLPVLKRAEWFLERDGSRIGRIIPLLSRMQCRARMGPRPLSRLVACSASGPSSLGAVGHDRGVTIVGAVGAPLVDAAASPGVEVARSSMGLVALSLSWVGSRESGA